MENKSKISINNPGKVGNLWQEIWLEEIPKKEVENSIIYVFVDKMTSNLFKVMNRSAFNPKFPENKQNQIKENGKK